MWIGCLCLTHWRSQRQLWRKCLNTAGVQWYLQPVVLAATYRGLCKASVQNKHNAILTGCLILLQLWSYERITIGRPLVDHSPYELDMNGDTEDVRPPWGLSGTLVRYGNDCYSYYFVGNSVALFDPLCISYWYILLISCRRVGPTYSLGGPILSL